MTGKILTKYVCDLLALGVGIRFADCEKFLKFLNYFRIIYNTDWKIMFPTTSVRNILWLENMFVVNIELWLHLTY
jgi:hypothetical protein